MCLWMTTIKIYRFQDVHKFTFTYGKQAGKRNLDVEVAIPLWQILFKNEVRPKINYWAKTVLGRMRTLCIICFIRASAAKILAKFSKCIHQNSIKDFLRFAGVGQYYPHSVPPSAALGGIPDHRAQEGHDQGPLGHVPVLYDDREARPLRLR